MKTIKINIYSPKELWVKFWNRVFWPRRKQCAEWMDLVEYQLEKAIITDIIIDQYDKGLLGESMTEQLELATSHAIKTVCKNVKQIICKPLD